MQDEMLCPHCNAELTLKQVIILLNGSGYERNAKVRLPDGQIAYISAGSVNPNEVEILE